MGGPSTENHWWRRHWTDLALAGLAFVVSLGFYVATLSPGLSYVSPDGNELITICATLGLAHATGYPLYTWMGKLFSLLPIGTVAYRVNLMSAVLGAAGVALLYGIGRVLLTSSRRPAIYPGVEPFVGDHLPPAEASTGKKPESPAACGGGEWRAISGRPEIACDRISRRSASPSWLFPWNLPRMISRPLLSSRMVLPSEAPVLAPGRFTPEWPVRQVSHPGQARLVALFVALLFAFSLAFWSQTTIAEVYAPNLFLVALTLFLFLLWARQRQAGSPRSNLYLLLAVLSLGLSVGTHMSNLGFVPVYGLFVLMVYPQTWRRPLLILGAGCLFGLGLLQFLWLPYKAYNLTDAMMLRNTPTTWEGFYNYTLGAFPQMKFAFSLPEIPERIVLYLELLRQNVGVVGMLGGLYGLAEMLWRRTAHFYLLLGMYLVHVFFFVQYRVFDLDVFFIPAHFLYVIAIGYGAVCVLAHLKTWAGRFNRRRLGAALSGLVALTLLGGVVLQAASNYTRNDRSGDTAAEDFYENVFRLLPQGSVLLGQGGVFGYDMFYYRLVEDPRPDVVIPLLAGPRVRPDELRGAEIYTTQRLQGGLGGPGGFNVQVLPNDAWYVPVLVGESSSRTTGMPQRELVLYHVSTAPPELILEEANPQVRVGRNLGGLRLEGYTLEEDVLEAGEALHLTLYWRVIGQHRGLITTALGETELEAHALGFGNLERYIREVRPLANGVVVEDYYLVVPSDASAGSWQLRVGLAPPLLPGEERPAEDTAIALGRITVTERGE